MRELTRFRKLLRKHGLESTTLKSGHNGIFKDGKKIYRYAGSPKNAYQAVDNSIKDLVKLGYLPPLTYNGKEYKCERVKNTGR